MEKPVAGTGSPVKRATSPSYRPPPRDGAEAHGAAVLVLHLEGQLGLEDRAGVVFEAAYDGGVDQDAAAQ